MTVYLTGYPLSSPNHLSPPITSTPTAYLGDGSDSDLLKRSLERLEELVNQVVRITARVPAKN